jgi:hypothetical protein
MSSSDKQQAGDAVDEITEENMQQIEEFLLNEEEETEAEREARLLEERRRRREEILRKHANDPPPGEQQKPFASDPPQGSGVEARDDDDEEKGSKPQVSNASSSFLSLFLTSPHPLCLLQAFPVTSRDVDVEAAALMAEREAVEAEEKREATISFDIFSSSPTTDVLPLPKGNPLGKRAMREALLEGEDPLLQSNWDDGEGYYKTRIGEIICDRCALFLCALFSDSRQVPDHGRGGKRSLLDCPQMSRLAPHRPL